MEAIHLRKPSLKELLIFLRSFQGTEYGITLSLEGDKMCSPSHAALAFGGKYENIVSKTNLRRDCISLICASEDYSSSDSSDEELLSHLDEIAVENLKKIDKCYKNINNKYSSDKELIVTSCSFNGDPPMYGDVTGKILLEMCEWKSTDDFHKILRYVGGGGGYCPPYVLLAFSEEIEIDYLTLAKYLRLNHPEVSSKQIIDFLIDDLEARTLYSYMFLLTNCRIFDVGEILLEDGKEIRFTEEKFTEMKRVLAEAIRKIVV